jgi:diadenosine tetraphosphate (Ap4A) HIT family hydrolase
MSFSLDPRLAADTIEIGDLELSRLLLMDDARYLWLVLAPRHENLSEIIHLGETDRAILMEEIAAVSRALIGFAGVDKINVGALGNIVSQLHIHVVARSKGDAAWPGPVWGAGVMQRYEGRKGRELARDFRAALILKPT